MINWILSGLIGGVIRVLEGAIDATPTFIVGLLIAAVFRYYLGHAGTRSLFGGQSVRSLPQSWAVGMLLPVCSIGVLPILFEMHRAKVKPGALSAFALSAPLFNPLSLLYGLTLSRPLVVVMFALGSLGVVTLVGLIWDWLDAKGSKGQVDSAESDPDSPLIGTQRLLAMTAYITRSLTGRSGLWAITGLLGLMLLAFVLPYGAMQHSVERDDPWAPATMAAVSLAVYATPMLAMTQLGMMFLHANSPGAAFVLLVLGTGVNFATILWLARAFGKKSVSVWLTALLVIVISIAYAINRPLITVGVEPAGHTHAFDIYTNPLHSLRGVTAGGLVEKFRQNIELGEFVSLAALGLLALTGGVFRVLGVDEQSLHRRAAERRAVSGATENHGLASYDRIVPPQLVGGVMLCGLVALSIVMCYAYYPSPAECLEEIRVARTECLSAANSGNAKEALYWLPVWEDWSRRMEVGAFIRRGEVRPYQRMQGYLIRKKMELLEHELEHEPFEIDETQQVVREIMATNARWVAAFRE